MCRPECCNNVLVHLAAYGGTFFNKHYIAEPYYSIKLIPDNLYQGPQPLHTISLHFRPAEGPLGLNVTAAFVLPIVPPLRQLQNFYYAPCFHMLLFRASLPRQLLFGEGCH